MTARRRIENLTNAWYGFTVFAAVASIVEVALWPFAPALLFSPVQLALTFVGTAFALVWAIGLNIVVAAIGLAMTTFFGRALLARSSVTRLFLAVASPVFAVFFGWNGLKRLWTGVSHLSPSALVGAGVAFIAVALYVRSFRVLTDPEVKGYVARS